MMLWRNKKFAKPSAACTMRADWLSPILNLLYNPLVVNNKIFFIEIKILIKNLIFLNHQ